MHRSFLNIKYFLLLSLAFFVACEEVVDWELTPGDNQKLVVEAIITDEFIQQEVRLSLSVDDLNEESVGVMDAIVFISDGQDSLQLFPEIGDPGLYRTENRITAQPTINYKLTINWQGKIYQATATMGPVSPIRPITFSQLMEKDSFFVNQVTPVFDPTEQNMIQLFFDWSHLTQNDSSVAIMNFYTFNTVDVSQLVPPNKAVVYYPKGTFVTVKKFGLADDFAGYLRALVMETEWKGGVFDEAESSIPTNINSDGLGWFAVCAVRQELLIVE